MADWRRQAIRAGLEALYFSGAHLVMRPVAGGVGLILTLHHVRPARPDPFQPNRLLEITPDFLTRVARKLRASRIDVVPLDEVHRRLTAGEVGRRFVAVTFDDGYRDTAEFAHPILRRYDIPYTVFVASGFADRTADMWWLTLEAVVAASRSLTIEIDGQVRVVDCNGTAAKEAAFAGIYWWLRTLDEATLRRTVRDLALRYGVDVSGTAARLCMDWRELAALAADPLVTIGAHTVTHPRLKTLPEKLARAEMAKSAEVIGAALGRRPEHFAYPVGDPTSAGPREFALARELGFKTAVTTRPGMLFRAHADHLFALPRVSLNGLFQAGRYVDVFLSGAPFALVNRFRRVNAA